MQRLHRLPFFDAIASSKRILLVGAGGGFDIFAGIPLYFALREMEKEVVLANLSFASLQHTTSEQVANNCFRVTNRDIIKDKSAYFPEAILCRWLQAQGIDAQVYAFARTGVRTLRDAYKFIARQHGIDTIILIDGGTDSLMFGDEEGLGTPEEDMCSMVAATMSSITRQYLVGIGFGVDHFHGVSHFRFLENVATLTRSGAYLGMWQLLATMPEAQYFLDAVDYANAACPDRPSIVCNSIASALRGEYGDAHATHRTEGSNLWINPLMACYWAFDLRGVVEKVTYTSEIKDTKSYFELAACIRGYREKLSAHRPHRRLPI